MNDKKCTACPRKCSVDRTSSLGFCSSPNKIKIARVSRHMWEEPCISGINGSGTVFFSGCNLKCVYCQNEAISRGQLGVELSEKELRDLFLRINDSDVHNINLVTPTHYLPSILEAIRPIKRELNIPIVCNCSGYEEAEWIERSKDIIDIFLTDIKYRSKDLSQRYSSCTDYFEVAMKALDAMLSAVGEPIIENGLMKKGIIVRHLILPSHKDDSINILNALFEKFGNKAFLVSLMNQFTPNSECKNYPEINRKLTSLEYKRVAEVYEKLGFNGYLQEKASASPSYVPDFNDKGEFLI